MNGEGFPHVRLGLASQTESLQNNRYLAETGRHTALVAASPLDLERLLVMPKSLFRSVHLAVRNTDGLQDISPQVHRD